MASESALTATETLWKPAGTHEFAFHFLLQEFALSGDAQYALSGVGGVTGLLRRSRTFPAICSMALMRWEMAEGSSQDICCRVEGAVFNDGGEGGELVGTETCHKNIFTQCENI